MVTWNTHIKQVKKVKAIFLNFVRNKLMPMFINKRFMVKIKDAE